MHTAASFKPLFSALIRSPVSLLRRPLLQGVSILARRQQPHHVLAFLQALAPVAAATGAVARQVLAEMRQVAGEVQERWEARQKQLQEGEAAAAAAAGGSAATTQDDIRRYFERRQRQRQRHAASAAAAEEEGGGGAHAPEEMERGALQPSRLQLPLQRMDFPACGLLAT